MQVSIKTEIMDRFDAFETIKKVADVQAEIGGQIIRVVIRKGKALAIKVDGETVWTPEHEDSVIDRLQSLLQPGSIPEAELKGGYRTKITDEWIGVLTEEANKSGALIEGDSVRLRVATSRGRRVSAAVDIYRAGQKIGSGGREKKINFATRGITDKWRESVYLAISWGYSKINRKKAGL